MVLGFLESCLAFRDVAFDADNCGAVQPDTEKKPCVFRASSPAAAGEVYLKQHEARTRLKRALSSLLFLVIARVCVARASGNCVTLN